MKLNSNDEELKDKGAKMILNVISTNNNKLRRLFLDFSWCEVTFESGIYIGELFSKLSEVKDVTLILAKNT